MIYCRWPLASGNRSYWAVLCRSGTIFVFVNTCTHNFKMLHHTQKYISFEYFFFQNDKYIYFQHLFCIFKWLKLNMRYTMAFCLVNNTREDVYTYPITLHPTSTVNINNKYKWHGVRQVFHELWGYIPCSSDARCVH